MIVSLQRQHGMHKDMEITQKEMAIISAIGDQNMSDQRAIAYRAGISLGLTNLLIIRLIKKGYIKTKQLNKRKLHYLLTPKGFSEKARKSYLYTQKSIALIRSIKHRLATMIQERCKMGVIKFTVIGDNEELFDMLEMIVRNARRDGTFFEINKVVLHAQALILQYEDPETREKKTIDVIEYLSETGTFWQ
jgi:predicted transcriptional regulator